MFDFISYGAEKLQLMMLVGMRVAGLFVMAPVFGNRAIPGMIKAALAIALAITILPTVAGAHPPHLSSLFDLAFFGLKEFVIGCLLGFVMQLLFHAIRMAGSWIGLQNGLSVASIVDPSSAEEVNIIGEFWLVAGLVIFFCVDGHHALISGLADSYKAAPLSMGVIDASAVSALVGVSGLVFSMALKFAAPTLVTILLIDIASATLARTMPQMNVFVIGVPVKIAVSIAVVGLSLPMFAWALGKMVVFLDAQTRGMMEAVAIR